MSILPTNYGHLSLGVDRSKSQRPSSLPQQTEFGLVVDERTRNELTYARWSELTMGRSDQIPYQLKMHLVFRRMKGKLYMFKFYRR